MQTLSTLLRERSPVPIGSVVLAFNAICPDRLALLHQHYRRLCRMILDADEWSQIHLLDLLGRYARTMLQQPPVSHSVDVRLNNTFICLKMCPESYFAFPYS